MEKLVKVYKFIATLHCGEKEIYSTYKFTNPIVAVLKWASFKIQSHYDISKIHTEMELEIKHHRRLNKKQQELYDMHESLWMSAKTFKERQLHKNWQLDLLNGGNVKTFPVSLDEFCPIIIDHFECIPTGEVCKQFCRENNLDFNGKMFYRHMSSYVRECRLAEIKNQKTFGSLVVYIYYRYLHINHNSQ